VQPAALSGLIDRWSPEPREAGRAQRKIYGIDAFRAALADDQIELHYQPKVSVASGQAVGVEALARWRHPEDGLVMPDQFIGVAEEGGLIDDLTRRVLIEGFGQARRWKDQGIHLKVAVNLSTDNLTSLGFADFVSREAERAGVAPQDVVLEVTESRLIKDFRAPLEVLARLRMKRFHISIDDFGTGHSSLVQLRDLPFSELKIDRGFVHGAWNNDTKRVIYDASCGIARQLGMEIVAEGVETQEDWQFLRETGCGLAQGYFIGKPLAAQAFPGWLANWKARLAELDSQRATF
jgi:EAL domain-containing protein (putative c-di-GMP-specific phosphodiesterase class I)